MRVSPLFLTLLFAMLASACGTNFPPEEIIEKDRPLAGRISVAGDPTRSTPGPGETATYEFLVASPGKQVGWSYYFVACPIIRTATGVAFCDPAEPRFEPMLGVQTNPPATTPPFVLPSITFTVPTDLRPDQTEAAIVGVLCPDSALDPAILQALLDASMSGDPSALTTLGNPCLDKSKNGLLVSSPFPLESVQADLAEVRNHTPFAQAVSLATEIVTPVVAGTPWNDEAPDDASDVGCAGMGYTEVNVGGPKLGFVFDLDPAAREMYEKPSPVAGEPPVLTTEIPYVRGYATAGTFHILLDHKQTDTQKLELTWSPPTTIKSIEPITPPPTSQLVRFWFLVRDDRQGDRRATSWVERALCVVTPP